jgi:hypothetical protein
MSILGSLANKDAAVIMASSHPPRLRSVGRGSKDLRHCLTTYSCRDNERAPASFRTAAKMRDRMTALVVLVGADQSALEQAGKEIA